eukprot:m.256111 g.256111  ORF g.256111 m.256111 type:complete len:133 (+) comp15512_c4_seq1:378-776(+)
MTSASDSAWWFLTNGQPQLDRVYLYQIDGGPATWILERDSARDKFVGYHIGCSEIAIMHYEKSDANFNLVGDLFTKTKDKTAEPQNKNIRFLFPKGGLTAAGRVHQAAREVVPVHIGAHGDALQLDHQVRLI